jgi:hypothetical protein
MRNRGLLTELLAHPGDLPLWRVITGSLIRARAEITVFIVWLSAHLVLVAGGTGLCRVDEIDYGPLMSGREALLLEAGALIVLLVIPPSRRVVESRMWAVADRHRVRACLVETRTMTPSGKLPYLVWSRPSPIGERLQVWLPAGLSRNDLDVNTEALAAACFAAEARVEVNEKWSHLVVLTIVRRDPLTGKKVFRPRHSGGVPTNTRTGGFQPLPDRDDLLGKQTPPAQHPGVVAAMASAKSRRNGRVKPAASNSDSSDGPDSTGVVGVGGMDVSDYV